MVKRQLVTLHNGRVFTRLVATASLSNNSEVQYNSAGILGQLSINGRPANNAICSDFDSHVPPQKVRNPGE